MVGLTLTCFFLHPFGMWVQTVAQKLSIPPCLRLLMAQISSPPLPIFKCPYCWDNTLPCALSHLYYIACVSQMPKPPFVVGRVRIFNWRGRPWMDNDRNAINTRSTANYVFVVVLNRMMDLHLSNWNLRIYWQKKYDLSWTIHIISI